MATLDSLAPHLPPATVSALREWLRGQALALDGPWRQRLSAGHVREGHGDLHLANLIVWRDTVTAFDCIEFDPALRWIDTIDDTAFAVMDLWAHGRRDLAFGFLNAYLDASGDHTGLTVLRHCLVSRALVRAWVAVLRSKAAATQGPDYPGLAQQLTAPGDARLLITHGLPGSGKSHVTAQLLAQAGAIRLRSDVERRRLSDPEGRYSRQTTEKTFAHLAAMARVALRAGWPVIVDAAFLMRAERDRMRDLAVDEGVPFTILHCHADPATLRAACGSAQRTRRRPVGSRPGGAGQADGDRAAARRRRAPAGDRPRNGPGADGANGGGLAGRWISQEAG